MSTNNIDIISILFGKEMGTAYSKSVTNLLPVLEGEAVKPIEEFIKNNLSFIVPQGKVPYGSSAKHYIALVIITSINSTPSNLYSNALVYKAKLGSVFLRVEIPKSYESTIRSDSAYFIYGKYEEREDKLAERTFRTLYAYAVIPADKFATNTQETKDTTKLEDVNIF